MIMTRESLMERFRLLSDEDLLGLLQSGDLIDLAKELATEELQRRGVELAMPATESNTASEDALSSEDNTPSGEGDLMVIERLFTPIEAHMLQSRLQADGGEWRFCASPIRPTAVHRLQSLLAARVAPAARSSNIQVIDRPVTPPLAAPAKTTRTIT
jgi:hypothetical protein